MPDEPKKKTFNINSLNEQEKSDFEFVKGRIQDLQTFRQETQWGMNIERLWEDADKDYVPHRLSGLQGKSGLGKKILEQDETKGWRGASSIVRVGQQDWQSDISQPNPYIKIQTAMAILIDQNPSGVFTAASKKYQATTNLMKQLYQRSWEVAKSKQQLKLFVFNLAKYGWAVGRTYPLKISRKVKQLVDYNEEEPDKSQYQEKEIVEFNDIFRENLDPWNTWIDDMTRANNQWSMRDWCYRKVYAMDVFKEEFIGWKNVDLVQSGGTTTEKIDEQKSDRKFKEKELVEVYFYENKIKDLFYVIANNVPVVMSPLPVADAHGNKKLSLWHSYWTLRDDDSPYGIGIYEAMRYDQALLDRVRNMSIDQLTLSIYKMFFYTGTQSLTETGDVKVQPGVGKQTLDPKNINWLDIPGPGKDAVEWLALFRKSLDEVSGITDPLIGEVTGKTAFEIAQAKEAALKRLKTPLENITDALDTEAYITISLIQLLYSVPEVYKISDSALVEDYLREIQSDPELYSRDEEGNFEAKVFREFPLNLDIDEDQNLTETEETQFFRVKPKFLKWEGIVNVKSQSILTPSKQVDKALELEMWNMLIPLMAQDPMIYQKAAKSIIKLYDKDPRDVLPDTWLLSPEELQMTAMQGQPLIVPQEQVNGGSQGGAVNQAPQAQTLTSRTQVPTQPQGLAQRIIGRLTQPFR